MVLLLLPGLFILSVDLGILNFLLDNFGILELLQLPEPLLLLLDEDLVILEELGLHLLDLPAFFLLLLLPLLSRVVLLNLIVNVFVSNLSSVSFHKLVFD